MQGSDRSNLLRAAVESPLEEFSKAQAPGISPETKQTAALNLQRAVIDLTNYLRRNVFPNDLKKS
jgi:hypothetical protein